jgi:Fe-S cluster assembly protein SufD
VNEGAFDLGELRRGGEQAFVRHGLPGRRVEAWKYTPLDALAIDPSSAASIAPRVTEHKGNAQVQVVPLAQALAEGAPGLHELLVSLDTSQAAQALLALNNAALDQGLYIRVPAGVDGGRLSWTWPTVPAGQWQQSRICVLLEEGSRLELLEQFESGGSGALNVVTQVSLAERARLQHARLQTDSTASALVTRTEVTQARASEYRLSSLDIDGQLVRHDVRSRLQGDGAACSLRGAYLLAGKAHVDNHLEIIHLGRDGRSEQTYRGVLDGQSRAVFNGRVHVSPGADGAEARQSNANLLLSADAEVDTKPELEIETDEVVASHGATVGQLDETAVFYLRSRGLGEDQARRMLTGAFCRSVLDGLPDSPARELLSDALDSALGDLA